MFEQTKPCPISSLIDFRMKSVSMNEKFVTAIDSQGALYLWGTLSSYLSLLSPVQVIGHTSNPDSPNGGGLNNSLGIHVKKASPLISRTGESFVLFIATDANDPSVNIFGVLETDLYFRQHYR